MARSFSLPHGSQNSLPRSPAERLWLIGGGVAAGLIVLVGYFFFIGPQRSDTADVNAQADSARTQNALLSMRITQLQQQNKNLPKYEAELAQARLALPTTSGISDFLRSLQSLGSSTFTEVTALTVGQPTDVTTIAGASTPSSGSTAGSTPSATAGSTPSAAPTTSSGSTPSGPAIYELPITATVAGTVSNLDRFLEQLQSVQPRAVLITQLTQSDATAVGGTAPHAGPTSTSLQLTMQAFVAPSNPTESASLSAAAH
ncbi:MAG: hypothetical protein J0H43_13450 [Actinobacteria bacterium]|nr:hypothetical protein [Actinomycetota bacterium]